MHLFHKKKKAKRASFVTPLLAAGVLSFGILSLSGCSGGGVSSVGSGGSVFTVGGENCSKEEAKVILLQFQKDCRSVYGLDLWTSSSVDQEDLADYIKNAAISQLAYVYTLDAAAQNLGIELSDEEEDQARAAAKEYVDSLTQEEKDYTGISESGARDLFDRYLLAQKTYDTIEESVPTEVSDEDALVMDMEQIIVSDEDQARQILSLCEEGEDFTALAETYSESDVIETEVSRLNFDEAVMNQLFDLEDGAVSNVILVGDKYYLFCCVNSYDESETEANKANILSERKEAAVQEACIAYADPADSVLRNRNWSEVEVDPSLDLAGPTFQEVYQKYFS